MSKDHALTNQLHAIILFKKELYNEAAAAAEKAISNGLDSQVSRLIAGTSRFQLQQYEQSHAHLSRIIDTLPVDHPIKRLYIAVQLKIGNEASIIDTVDSSQINSADLLTATSLDYINRGQIEKAKELLSENDGGVAFDDAVALVKKGLLKSLLNLEGASSDLEQALQLEPDNRRIQITLAMTYLKERASEQLIDLSSRYQSSNPESVIWYTFSGQAYEKLGKIGEASKQYQQVLAFAPEAFTSETVLH